MKYLDQATVSMLKRFRRSRLDFNSLQGYYGFHRGMDAGFGQEFLQHKQYSVGDDIRFLNWKILAGRDRLYIKEYEQEKSLTVYIVVDSSASMSFSGGGISSKWEYSCRLAMAAACSFILRGDYCGLVIASDAITVKINPSGELPALEKFDAALAAAIPGGSGAMLGAAASVYGGGAAAVLISDLLPGRADMVRTAKALKTRRNSAAVLHVLDPHEADMPWQGRSEIRDLETGAGFNCEPAVLRAGYKTAFANWLRLCQLELHKSSIGYARFFTDAPVSKALAKMLAVFRRRD